MIKYIAVILCVAVFCVTGCHRDAIKESEMEETVMTKEVIETEATTEVPRSEPSFAAQLKAAKDLEQLIIVEAHSREGITATVTMHEKQNGLWTEILNVDGKVVVSEEEANVVCSVKDGCVNLSLSVEAEKLVAGETYTLVIESFEGCKKADAPLVVKGEWECTFEVN